MDTSKHKKYAVSYISNLLCLRFLANIYPKKPIVSNASIMKTRALEPIKLFMHNMTIAGNNKTEAITAAYTCTVCRIPFVSGTTPAMPYSSNMVRTTVLNNAPSWKVGVNHLMKNMIQSIVESAATTPKAKADFLTLAA